MIPDTYFTIDMLVKIIKIAFSIVTFLWSLLVLRNLIDLQDNFNSLAYGLFLIIVGFLVFVSGLSLAGLIFY